MTRAEQSRRQDTAAVLYSGGTDSTLVAYKAGGSFRQVHLLTFRRFGMFHLQHSENNVEKLREALGREIFIRPPILCIDRLFKHVSYESYLGDLRRHGFMVLTTCGLCKLAMHLRSIVYCVEHDVGVVWDGANRNMTIFPAQMEMVLRMLRGLYALAGIRYENPIYDYDDEQGINFGSFIYGLSPARKDSAASAAGGGGTEKKTSGDDLFRLGLLPKRDVKGTAIDKQMQGRCYQFVLFNLWARWYYLERGEMESYRAEVSAYYEQKIKRCEKLVMEYLDDPPSSLLHALTEDRG